MEARQHEARSSEWNDRPIVRVEATVMIRGEVGFTPHLGYGNSKIAIYESLSRTEYLLYGYRIQDKKITLDVLIPHHMPFTVATPIFHHWSIGDQRMGLSFNGTADARAFDRGIRIALENLEKAHANMSGSSRSSTSEEPNSISPTSIQSFNLSLVDDGSDSSFVSRPPPPPPLPQRVFSTLPIVPTFRQQTLSASSPRVVSHSATVRPQRRHSSSVPGRPLRLASPHSRSPPSSATELSSFPIPSNRNSPTTDSPFKNSSQFPKDTGSDSPKPFFEKRMGSIPVPDSRDTRQRSSSEQHRSRRPNHHRSTKRTKTPNLDHLERQRDLQPTKLNSYVQFSSAKTNTVNTQLSQKEYIASRLGLNTNDSLHVGYQPSRNTNSHRVGDINMHKYPYQGLKTTDDAFWDYYGKPYSNSSSFHDSNYVYNLKQAAQLKTAEFSKFGPSKGKEDLGERLRCRHCQAMYNHDRNRRGSCPCAPQDRMERGIEYASCLPVAHCVFKQCFHDPEDSSYADHPCSCSHYSGGISRRRRWIFLGLLSCLIPCLCLYPLLKSCHHCGIVCHCCGGRHAPMSSPRENRTDSSKG